MKAYFEFNEHDYYAVVAVEIEGNKNTVEKAYETYLNTVAGDSLEGVKEEGDAIVMLPETAFWKFANAAGSGEQTVKELIDDFNSLKDTCLVIDGALF